MKKTVKIILACVMGAYALLGLIMVVSSVYPRINNPALTISATAATEEKTIPSESGYVVKTVSGRIAVEDASTGEIIKTTDTRVAILPEKDRDELERGITVSDKSELRSVLEDLCS